MRDRRGISSVIVVMLSLVLVVIVVGNVVLWSYQMNQFDWERMRESMEIVDVRNSWSYHPSTIVLHGSTSLVSGSLSDVTSNDGVYMSFRSYASAASSQSLFAHAETTVIGGATYYVFKSDSADGSATTLSASMSSVGRQLWGRFAFPLSGVSVIPSSPWAFYYRAWHSGGVSGSETSVLRPNGAGTYTEWASVHPSGTPHWDAVNDVAPDDDAPYIETEAAGDKDTFQLTNVPDSGTVSSVKVYARAKRLPGLPGAMFNLMIRTYGADYFGSGISPGVVYDVYSHVWTKNPGTGADWTVAEINSLEVGVQCTGTRAVRVIQIYVEVEYASQSVEGYADVDVRVLRSDGSVRQVIAANVANSDSLTGTAQTLSGAYSWSEYTVVDETDYLEIAYYCHVTAAGSDVSAFLRIDDNFLAVAGQTRVANVVLPSEYTLEVEFEGSSNVYDWNRIVWSVDSAFTIGNVAVALQLYDYSAGEYSASGEGYMFYISSASGNTDELKDQSVTSNPARFRDVHGNWKLKVLAVKETSTRFDFKADWVEFKPVVEGAFFTFRNRGSLTVRLVSLWVVNSTDHQRYDVSIFVNSGETLPVLRGDVHLPSGEWVVRVVTERGNVVVFLKDSYSV